MIQLCMIIWLTTTERRDRRVSSMLHLFKPPLVCHSGEFPHTLIRSCHILLSTGKTHVHLAIVQFDLTSLMSRIHLGQSLKIMHKSHKSPGPDGLHPRVLKELSTR